MVSDAEAHADEDRKQRELAEAKNIGENAAYTSEKQVEELGDKIDATSKTEIEGLIKELRDSLETDDAEKITGMTEKLQTAFHKVSEQVYQAAQAEAQAAGAEGAADGGASSDEEEVIDAEVVDEDENK